MTPERQTRRQKREAEDAKKSSQHVDAAKLREKFDNLIHDIDEVLGTNE